MVIATVFTCLGLGSRTQVFDTKTWTVPTFVGGRLYLRDQNELVSLHVAR